MGGVRQGGRGAFETEPVSCPESVEGERGLHKADGMGSILSLKSKYIQ